MGLANSQTADCPLAILVDDDAEVRDSLEELLSSVGIDSISFSSAQEVLGSKLPDRPGCIVLDVRMPGMSGMDLQQLLVTKEILTPIVFLTGHGDIAMSVEAMKAGAVDFLTKPVRDQTFLDAVSTAIATDVARRAASAVAKKNSALYQTLTPREREVLRFVISGAMNKQIAFDLGISEITVKLHRSNMMKKMDARSVSHLFNVCQSLPPDILYQLKIPSTGGKAVLQSGAEAHLTH
ncbi:response regulator transcription factor [Mesorhizobium sp. B2-8-9]|uniref:response regulator transcription factor n=1 Tax=Mesorhizobium sp. B2-8-9 TaxID=2589899 RepID=UPI001126EA76|nr:response regulator transcription factor [Mesorhizobium sp. B2-8-9]TPI78471.1 response regulator transcription factor [Mesorhizobium sp. B2-8-9]